MLQMHTFIKCKFLNRVLKCSFIFRNAYVMHSLQRCTPLFLFNPGIPQLNISLKCKQYMNHFEANLDDIQSRPFNFKTRFPFLANTVSC